MLHFNRTMALQAVCRFLQQTLSNPKPKILNSNFGTSALLGLGGSKVWSSRAQAARMSSGNAPGSSWGFAKD